MVKSTDRELEHRHSENRFSVVPTALRPGVDPDRTARGVTIAFFDSGFHPHPDLTHSVSRTVAYKDIANPSATLKSNKIPEESVWRVMTSVAAAGNGYLSDLTKYGGSKSILLTL